MHYSRCKKCNNLTMVQYDEEFLCVHCIKKSERYIDNNKSTGRILIITISIVTIITGIIIYLLSRV